MTLHIDVFLYKQGNVREVVYVKAITLRDKGLSETLEGLVDAVLQESPIYIVNQIMLVHTKETLHLKFSMKSVNPKIQSLCVMITTSPVVEKIAVTGKVLLQNILFAVLLMLDITC